MVKKFLKILGVFSLVLVVLGVAGYISFFKPNPKMQEQLKNEFGSEYFDPGPEAKLAYEDVNKSVIDKVIEAIQNFTKNDNNSVVIKPETAPINEKSTSIATANPTVIVTEADIIQKYVPQFRSLENQSSSRMEALYSAGIAEWRQRKRNGTLNRSELARKYIQAGKMIEANVDGQFYSLLNEMQSELIANNLPTDVTSIVKSEYYNAKAKKRTQLLSRVGL